MLCDSDTIMVQDVAAVLPSEQPVRRVSGVRDNGDPSLSGLEKRQILEVLSRTKSRKEAAEILGISKTTLWRKCKELGLE